jgi:hypothetical protein
MTALVLLFLVSPGDGDAAVTQAMRQAAIQVLGSATAIVIREAPDDLADVAAIERGNTLHAAVVVRVSWTSRAYLHARLRVHLAGTSEWTNRDVGFESRDAPAERGRALGYSVAAVVAGDTTPGGSPTGWALGATTPASPVPAAPPLPIGGDVTTSDAAGGVTQGRPTSPGFSFFLDAAAVASSGLGGSGGQARLGWSMTRRLVFVLGGGARIGTVGVAQANSSHLYATGGAAFDVISFWRIAVSGRGEALLMRQSLSHFSADDVTPVKRTRWLPGFRPQLEVSLWPSRRAAIVASAGWELTAGSTDVYVRSVKVSVIPATRRIGEIGLRVHF